MTQNQVGCQTVGCRVTSCRYNDKGSYCELSRIQIEPSQRPHDPSCGTVPCRSENAAAFKAGFRFVRLGAACRPRAF